MVGDFGGPLLTTNKKIFHYNIREIKTHTYIYIILLLCCAALSCPSKIHFSTAIRLYIYRMMHSYASQNNLIVETKFSPSNPFKNIYIIFANSTHIIVRRKSRREYNIIYPLKDIETHTLKCLTCCSSYM